MTADILSARVTDPQLSFCGSGDPQELRICKEEVNNYHEELFLLIHIKLLGDGNYIL